VSRQTAIATLLLLVSCGRSSYAPPPCEVEACGGHGTCLVQADGKPLCACDPGFHNVDPLTCESDSHSTVEPNPDAASTDRGYLDRDEFDGSRDSGLDAGTADARLVDHDRADSIADAGAGDVDAAAARDGGVDATPVLDAGGADGGAVDGGAATDRLSRDVAAADSVTGPDAVVADAAVPDTSQRDGGTGFDASGWIFVAGGTYNMGCSLGDPDCLNNELPAHAVTVAPFYLQRTEVTQAQFQVVMGSNPSSFSSCGSTCPVENVTWDQARAYCLAIGGRLPSEAEWEFANRAGSTTPFSCGTLVSCITNYAWSFANSNTGGLPRTG